MSSEPKQYTTFKEAARSKEGRAFRKDLEATSTAEVEAVKARFDVILREAEEAHAKQMEALKTERFKEISAALRARNARDRDWFAVRLPKEEAA